MRVDRRTGGWARRARWALTGATAAGLALLMPATASATPIRQQQWYVDALQIPKAQNITRGGGVVVAVIDGKIDGSNPDLSGQLVSGTAIGGGSTSSTHGTGVAGVIAARGGGLHHVVGVAPGAKIMPVELPDKFSDKEIATGIRYAVDHGAQVINISSGGVYDTPPSDEVSAVDYALSKNVVVVAAAGNTGEGMSAVASPAAIPGVVAVSGADKASNFWSGSVSGKQVVIAAPAVDIVSTGSTDGNSEYQSADGTSMAAPIVAGTVALIRAKYPKLDAANVINRLVETAKDQGDPGRDNYFGYGTVRPVDALTKDVPTVTKNPLGGGTGGGASAGSTATHPVRTAGAFHAHISTRGWITFAVVGLLVVVGIIVLIVVLAGRRRRRGNGSGRGGGPPVGAAGPGGYPGLPGAYGAAQPGGYQQPTVPGGMPPAGSSPTPTGIAGSPAPPPGAPGPPSGSPPGAPPVGGSVPGPPGPGGPTPAQPLWPQPPGAQAGGPPPRPPGR
ncbi:hypothetical protein Athai_57120 [Actinocatenispora thailandica]|uniref:Peptidase S8/S53 domain-containing protein n=1 Tax=Actinocatenispora thailandica TaxID=227318 RepID=A0A7R7I076_9ACTN|nr:S8 family serine peptidase [Actinocatenispora thailandica]BCJ38209.1 hypothetical protein Athai_57120 [Actinocatenispora thailandica]